MNGTGRVRFPVCSDHPEVQAYINQGVGQLHGFWFFEAERTFRQVAALDPECAAAYWGMAMANANNSDRAKKFIKQAMERKDGASPRIQHYIEALDGLLHSEDAKQASSDYVDALEQIVYEYPDDMDAKAFIAVHLWQDRRNDQPIQSHLAVDALIQQVLTAEPMHPVHHYRIHLWDREKPERALESAARCGQAAPSIAHMWHMPGHIYSRLHRYPDAVWQQEASARTDHAQMMRDRLLPDQIHNFAHNNEWLIRNLIHVGRFKDAVDLAKNMIELPRHPKYNVLSKRGCSADYGRRRLIQVLVAAEMWDELLALSRTPYLDLTDDRMRQVEWYHAVGVASYHLGREAEAMRAVDALGQRLCEEQADADVAAWEAECEARGDDKPEAEIAKIGRDARKEFDDNIETIEQHVDEIDGYLAMLAGCSERGLALLKESDVDPNVRARLHLKSGNVDEARQLAREHVESHENETVPLANLAYVQWRSGDLQAAKESMQRLREHSSDLNLAAAPFSRLAPLASQLEWPHDWTVPREPSTDVGNRPPLDALGPFRWQPVSAHDWALPDANGTNWSLSSFEGKPLVLIFYLGFGCLHCAEQLHEFGPQAEAFRAAGFEVAAISSDDIDGLKQSIEDYDGDIPFPLLADPTLEVFRAYRVFDSFEEQPLHGTFLIDGDRRVRWFDISYEPFMDPEFVLNEGVRVLHGRWVTNGWSMGTST